MTDSLYQQIIQKREMKNEKTVAIVRFALSLTGIFDLLSFFGIVNVFNTIPSDNSVFSSAFLFIYSSITIIILLRNIYIRKLKYFVILFDYAYVILAFLTDKSLTMNPEISIWYAFAGCIVFYLINLLRYSRGGTVFALILTVSSYFLITLVIGIPIELIMMVAMPLSLILFIGFSVTASNKSMIIEANTKQMMERYLAPQLVSELYNKNTTLDAGGMKKKVSILFADIRSFTSISEIMPPDKVVSILNSYLSKMTDVIFSHKGTIDKFIGDAIMTVFGAPVSMENDALQAVRTAIEMQKALEEFNQEHKELAAPLEIGIGIHTGEAIAGNIGSQKRLDYTVIGDSVNISSRIEGLTKYYNCSILISGSTYDEVKEYKDEFVFREIDIVKVKGRSAPVKIYEVMINEN